MKIEAFFHQDTHTFSYLVWDKASRATAVIDPVLDFDPASGRISNTHAHKMIECIDRHELIPTWILETHAHADHLTAAQLFKSRYRCPVAIGAGITAVQAYFKTVLGMPNDFATDGRQFDRLLEPGDVMPLGTLEIRTLATPGHTPDSLSYLIGDAIFVGDSIFMPDIGTARCDFPGGDSQTLYQSIQSLFVLPADTRVLVCHDYPKNREAQFETTIAAQKSANIHVAEPRSMPEFVEMRRTRDAALETPRLLWPSLQVNINAGQLPPLDESGRRFLKIPLSET